MKRDDFKKKKKRLLNKMIGDFLFFILSLFSYFSVCFLTLKLLCVKKKGKKNSCSHFLTMRAV